MTALMHDDWTPKIGLFDSGIGGFTVLRHVLAACPGIPCVYVGDLAHVPYGERSLPEIHAIALNLIQLLRAEGCTHLLVACNTSTAALKDNPPDCPIPLINVIDPLRAWIASQPGLRRLGVAANPVTARRAIHAQVLEEARPVQVTTVGVPSLVHLLESRSPSEEILHAVREALTPLQTAEIEACIYGCTHYPLAAEAFQQVLGPAVQLIDTGALVAQELASLMPLIPGDAAPGPVEFIITAPSEEFGRWIETLFPADLQWTLRVQTPQAQVLSHTA